MIDFDKLINNDEICVCGLKHKVELKKIIIEPNASAKLPDVINEVGDYKNIAMICDENTYAALGYKVEELCNIYKTVKLNPENLCANEDAVSFAENVLGDRCELLLAVGSGTIHDITRFIAAKRSIDFISVPTAPSVDGFVSTVAAMTWNGVKKTFPAISPIALVADSSVIAKAPSRLIGAGVGDLLGKYTALFDWKVSNLVTGEYICSFITELEQEAIADTVANIDEIKNHSDAAVERLMKGLVLSGLAMQMCGNSRPASGSEHHISHFIEMKVINDSDNAYHGEKVGAATAFLCDKYHSFIKYLKKEYVKDKYDGIDELRLREIYGLLTDEIMKENSEDPLAETDPEKLKSALCEIAELASKLPTGDEIRTMLKKCGAPTKLSEIDIEEKNLPIIYEFAPYVRKRLTFMRLTKLFDID